MTATALYFLSVDELCLFLKETNLRKFLLLGKKSILIAEFSSEALSLAIDQFHASPVEMPEVEIIRQQKIESGQIRRERINS